MLNWLEKKINNRKGFTLIELIVVIAILGILAAIAVPKFGSSRINAAVSAHNANVRTIESAASMYIANTGNNPANIDALSPDYLNATPKIPSPISGKTVKSTADNTGVAMGTEYSITITNGLIVVTPNLIPTADSYTTD